MKLENERLHDKIQGNFLIGLLKNLEIGKIFLRVRSQGHVF